MENFASVDPEATPHRKGLAKVGPRCRAIFEDWVTRPDHLASCAAVLRRDAEGSRSLGLTLFDPNPVSIPRAFGSYDLLDYVGRGSYGVVYSCIHGETGEVGALKILDLKGKDDEASHRFVREIRALRAVDSSHVIRMLEDNLDDERDFPAFVMDLADCSLTEYANSKAGGVKPVLPREECVLIMRSMIAAICALHGQKPRLIHRDLNPNNILRLPDGRWVLADFGLAKFMGTAAFSTTFATRTHAGVGTGYYGAPEQFRDFKRTDGRTDVYALGVLLWELFTIGWPPPESSGLCAPLAEVFTKATARNPDDRYPTAEEFGQAFERVRESGLAD
jgi:serine/threonine protein kinase